MPSVFPVTADLIGGWRMTGPAGTNETDVSGNGNTLIETTLGPVPTVADNPFGMVVTSRDMSTNRLFYIQAPEVANFYGLNAITVHAWVKLTSTPAVVNTSPIVTVWNGGIMWELSVTPTGIGGAWYAWCRVKRTAGVDINLGGFGLSDLSVNVWHHLVLTWDGPTGASQLFVDDALADTDAVKTGTMSSGSGTRWLNVAKGYATGGWLPGRVIDIAVYSLAKDTTWVNAINAPAVAPWASNNPNWSFENSDEVEVPLDGVGEGGYRSAIYGTETYDG